MIKLRRCPRRAGDSIDAREPRAESDHRGASVGIIRWILGTPKDAHRVKHGRPPAGPDPLTPRQIYEQRMRSHFAHFARQEADKAKAAGSTEYVWRTAGDQAVCAACAKNANKRFPGHGRRKRGTPASMIAPADGADAMRSQCSRDRKPSSSGSAKRSGSNEPDVEMPIPFYLDLAHPGEAVRADRQLELLGDADRRDDLQAGAVV